MKNMVVFLICTMGLMVLLHKFNDWSAIKLFCDIAVDLIIIMTFLIGWESLKYRCDETSRKLYIENYNKIQGCLDKIVSAGKVEFEDINLLYVAKQDAMLYLDENTIMLIDKLSKLAIEIHCIRLNNDTSELSSKRQQEIFKIFGTYKTRLLVKHYRKHIIWDFDILKSFIKKEDNA